MSETSITPSEEAIKEAKKHPNGWVYQIDNRYDYKDYFPPETIIGAWKVDDLGNIIGQFIPNPKYSPIVHERL